MASNIRGKRNGRSKMVAYKHGGRTVPGMFKAQDGPGDKLDMIGPRPKTNFNPYTHFRTEQEYKSWVNAGSPEISTYKPPTQPGNPYSASTSVTPITHINPPSVNPQIPTGPPNPFQVIDEKRKKKTNPFHRKRGGSVGANGML